MKPSFPRLRCDDCGAIMDRIPDKPFWLLGLPMLLV